MRNHPGWRIKSSSTPSQPEQYIEQLRVLKGSREQPLKQQQAGKGNRGLQFRRRQIEKAKAKQILSPRAAQGLRQQAKQGDTQAMLQLAKMHKQQGRVQQALAYLTQAVKGCDRQAIRIAGRAIKNSEYGLRAKGKKALALNRQAKRCGYR